MLYGNRPFFGHRPSKTDFSPTGQPQIRSGDLSRVRIQTKASGVSDFLLKAGVTVEQTDGIPPYDLSRETAHTRCYSGYDPVLPKSYWYCSKLKTKCDEAAGKIINKEQF